VNDSKTNEADTEEMVFQRSVDTFIFLTLGTKAHARAATHKYYGLPRVEIRAMSLQANDKQSTGTDFVLQHHQDHVQGSTRIALRGTRLPDYNQIQSYIQMKNRKYH
jgi:hypothetical protein